MDLFASQRWSIARILVEVDAQQGLFESIDLVAGDNIFTQQLVYLNVSFLCAQCHIYGHVVADCAQIFLTRFGPKKLLLLEMIVLLST